jgi:hypothetical protein
VVVVVVVVDISKYMAWSLIWVQQKQSRSVQAERFHLAAMEMLAVIQISMEPQLTAAAADVETQEQTAAAAAAEISAEQVKSGQVVLEEKAALGKQKGSVPTTNKELAEAGHRPNQAEVLMRVEVAEDLEMILVLEE